MLVATLGNNPNIRIICEVSDGAQAVKKANELQPDLILLDIGLPSLNGIEAARQIRGLSPKSKIIFVTQETSPEVVTEALEAGASGYVVKTDAGRASAVTQKRPMRVTSKPANENEARGR
jgi:DNA-binding NarL/FixJ family response regulator